MTLTYEDAILEVETEKSQVITERDQLLSEVREIQNDLQQYQGQAEAFLQQAKLLKNKVIVSGLPEDIQNTLSKIDVIDSVAASISLSNLEVYELDALRQVQPLFGLPFDASITPIIILSDSFS